MPKWKNSNETFWVIFKQYALLEKRTFFVPKQSKASVESLFPNLEKKLSPKTALLTTVRIQESSPKVL